jgi:hypothetical protein
MPDISKTIRSITLADATVSGLVGTRMYSDALPQQATLPAIRYLIIDTLPTECLVHIAAIARARIQVDCYANTRAASVELADAVRLALEKKHEGDNSGQFIHEISLQDGERHAVDRPLSGTDQRWYITILEFYVFYTTTTS